MFTHNDLLQLTFNLIILLIMPTTYGYMELQYNFSGIENPALTKHLLELFIQPNLIVSKTNSPSKHLYY